MTRTPGITRPPAHVRDHVRAGDVAGVVLKLFTYIAIGLFLGTVATLVLG